MPSTGARPLPLAIGPDAAHIHRGEHVGELGGAAEHVGEADRCMQAELVGLHRVAQVRVDQHHVLAGAGEHQREVGDRRRGAVLLGRGREHDDARTGGVERPGEVQLGDPKRLGRGHQCRHRVGQHHQLTAQPVAAALGIWARSGRRSRRPISSEPSARGCRARPAGRPA